MKTQNNQFAKSLVRKLILSILLGLVVGCNDSNKNNNATNGLYYNGYANGTCTNCNIPASGNLVPNASSDNSTYGFAISWRLSGDPNQISLIANSYGPATIVSGYTGPLLVQGSMNVSQQLTFGFNQGSCTIVPGQYILNSIQQSQISSGQFQNVQVDASSTNGAIRYVLAVTGRLHSSGGQSQVDDRIYIQLMPIMAIVNGMQYPCSNSLTPLSAD